AGPERAGPPGTGRGWPRRPPGRPVARGRPAAPAGTGRCSTATGSPAPPGRPVPGPGPAAAAGARPPGATAVRARRARPPPPASAAGRRAHRRAGTWGWPTRGPAPGWAGGPGPAAGQPAAAAPDPVTRSPRPPAWGGAPRGDLNGAGDRHRPRRARPPGAERRPDCRGAGRGWDHAAPEPGDADPRDRRPSGPWPDDGQPWLSARAGPPAWCVPLAVAGVDLLRAGVAGQAARPDAAGPVDGAVLPRRGDRAGGRAPAVRVLPPPGFPRLRRGVA